MLQIYLKIQGTINIKMSTSKPEDVQVIIYPVDRTNLASNRRFSSLFNSNAPGVSNFCLIQSPAIISGLK